MQNNSIEDILQKSFPIGHISHRSNGSFKKIGKNEWVPVSSNNKRGDIDLSEEKKEVDNANRLSAIARNKFIVDSFNKGLKAAEIANDLNISTGYLQWLAGPLRKKGLIKKNKRGITLKEAFSYVGYGQSGYEYGLVRDEGSNKVSSFSNESKGGKGEGEREVVQLVGKKSKRFVNVVSEAIKVHLADYQKRFVNNAFHRFEKKNVFINMSGTGAGKTRMEVALADTFIKKNPDKKVLIVTKNENIMMDAFAKDGRTMGVPMAPLRPSSALGESDKNVEVITYSALAIIAEKRGMGYLKNKYGLVVFDECQEMKNSKSLKFKAGMGLLSEDTKISFNSATPVDAVKHTKYIFDAMNLHDTNGLAMRGRASEEEEVKFLIKFFTGLEREDGVFSCSIRMNNVSIVGANLRLSLKQKKYYNNISRAFKSYRKELEDRGVKGDKLSFLVSQELFRLSSFVASCAVPSAVDLAKKYVAEGKKVVIMMHSLSDSTFPALEDHLVKTAPVNIYAKHDYRGIAKIKKAMLDFPNMDNKELGNVFNMSTKAIKKIREGKTWENVNAINPSGNLPIVSGPLSKAEKLLAKNNIKFDSITSYSGAKSRVPEKIAKFQNGDTDVIITTPASGGVGINLDDKVGNKERVMIFLEPPFTASGVVQALGRIDRKDTKSKSSAVFLNVENAPTTKWRNKIIMFKLKLLGAFTKDAKYKHAHNAVNKRSKKSQSSIKSLLSDRLIQSGEGKK